MIITEWTSDQVLSYNTKLNDLLVDFGAGRRNQAKRGLLRMVESLKRAAQEEREGLEESAIKTLDDRVHTLGCIKSAIENNINALRNVTESIERMAFPGGEAKPESAFLAMMGLLTEMQSAPKDSSKSNACPVCESTLCRCCPDCHQPTCICDDIQDRRVENIADFITDY